MIPILRLLFLTASVAACGQFGLSTPTPTECPRMVPGYVPGGFAVDRESHVEAGDGRQGVLVIYGGPGDAELAFGSGVPGEVGGAETGRRVRIRGFDSPVLVGAADTQTAVWMEAPVEQPCHQYSVVGVGLSEEEFLRVLEAIR